jgi:hypothetical protein
MTPDADALVLGAFPWATPDVRQAVELLTPAQAAAYIREVRRQYRADQRERAHTVLEADLGADAHAIADARTARSHAGTGGGRRRRPDTNTDE